MINCDYYKQIRLVVSLTTLLVLYTLFNQTLSTLPLTAYVKMIDVWFIFCIVVLFFIIIFHVMVEYLGDDTSTSVVPLTKLENENYSPISKFSLKVFPAQKTLHFVRVIMVPVVVLVFLIVYWAAMLI